jgi:FlaA1/EpsC-like NDP-sugar epimerase
VEVTQLQLLADTSLTDIIRKFSLPESAAVEKTQVPATRNTGDATEMDALVRKFTYSLEQLSVNPILDHQTPSSHTVLLTGSTGALGCHLLAQLLANDSIQHIYAINREGPDGVLLVDRQAAALERQGLSPTLVNSEKLTLIVGDLRDGDFGISSETMDEVRRSASFTRVFLIL